MSAAAPPPGLRVVLDARPLQDPDRGPATARYLRSLLAAYDAAPLPGESFALLLQSDLDDPTVELERLPVIGRRLLPPTRLLRSGALTIDPFLLRGASLGAAWRADRGGAAGAVYHAVAGAPPMLSRIPIIVTLLDLAPWELPDLFQRGTAMRFGQRLRTQLIRDAAAVIVASDSMARAARRLLRVRQDRVHVIPLAADAAFATAGAAAPGETAATDLAAVPDEAGGASRPPELEALGVPPRFLAWFGRFDARQDVAALLRALAILGARSRPRGLPAGVPWPPRVLVLGASPDDRASIARLASKLEVGESLAYAPALPTDRLAAIVGAARAVVVPARSDGTGQVALDALAAGVPIVASSVGALPDVVGQAGILVEPGDADRLAAALRTAWADDRVHATLATAVRDRAATTARTWADVALDTRRLYARIGARDAVADGASPLPSGPRTAS